MNGYLRLTLASQPSAGSRSRLERRALPQPPHPDRRYDAGSSGQRSTGDARHLPDGAWRQIHPGEERLRAALFRRPPLGQFRACLPRRLSQAITPYRSPSAAAAGGDFVCADQMEPPRRRDLIVAAGFCACFEQIEQSTMLQQELLATEGKGALAGGAADRLSIAATTEVSSGSDGAELRRRRAPLRDRAPGALATNRRRGRSRNPRAQPCRSNSAQCFEGAAGAHQAGFRLGGSWGTRQRTDGGGQANQIEPLTLERFRCAQQPLLRAPLGQRWRAISIRPG